MPQETNECSQIKQLDHPRTLMSTFVDMTYFVYILQHTVKGLLVHKTSPAELPPAQRSVAMWYVFSSVRLCVCLFVCLFVNTITLEPFEISS